MSSAVSRGLVDAARDRVRGVGEDARRPRTGRAGCCRGARRPGRPARWRARGRARRSVRRPRRRPRRADRLSTLACRRTARCRRRRRSSCRWGRVCFPQVSTVRGRVCWPQSVAQRGDPSPTCGNLWKTDPSPVSYAGDTDSTPREQEEDEVAAAGPPGPPVVPAPAARLVPQARARPAVAGNARPVPHPRLRNHAAADAGRSRPAEISTSGSSGTPPSRRSPSRPSARSSAPGIRSATTSGPAASTRSRASRSSASAATLPDDEETLRSFKGIGAYTAGAVMSFAFGKRAAILDTNVARVLFRIFVGRGDPRGHAMDKHLWEISRPVLPHRHVFDFNQALMDFGATVCSARAPQCPTCAMKTQVPVLPLHAGATSPCPLIPGPSRRSSSWRRSSSATAASSSRVGSRARTSRVIGSFPAASASRTKRTTPASRANCRRS